MFSPRRRQKPRLQHLSVQKAFAATATGKAMLKLTPNSSMWQRAVLLVGEAACLHVPLSEMAVAAFSLDFFPRLYLEHPDPSALFEHSIPPSSNGLCSGRMSQKELLTPLENTPFLHASPCCVTAVREASPMPGSAWSWSNAVWAELKEGLWIGTMSSG